MSHIARIFVENPLKLDCDVELPASQGKYLTRVMRLTSGANVRAFNGEDGEWMCDLMVLGKSTYLKPLEKTRDQDQSLDLTLLFAPVKKARTDFIIEKATELGVRKIQPVITEYTQTQRVRTDRMRTLAIEAAEQTERLDLPIISEPGNLASVLSSWNPDVPLIYCDESGCARPMDQIRDELAGQKAGILIGPEGGFSPVERKMLRELAFVFPITLGPRILRAETAAVSALTLWQSLVGDWQKAPYLPQT